MPLKTWLTETIGVEIPVVQGGMHSLSPYGSWFVMVL